jgi:hypothetical protein
MHAYIHVYVHTCIHTCIHTYMHVYVHTHINTHTHTYIHVLYSQVMIYWKADSLDGLKYLLLHSTLPLLCQVHIGNFLLL